MDPSGHDLVEINVDMGVRADLGGLHVTGVDAAARFGYTVSLSASRALVVKLASMGLLASLAVVSVAQIGKLLPRIPWGGDRTDDDDSNGSVHIYRCPQLGQAAKNMATGFDPADFPSGPDPSNPGLVRDGKGYFSRSVVDATDFVGRTGYEKGYIEVIDNCAAKATLATLPDAA